MKYIILLFSVFSFAQQTQKVDFISMNGSVYPNAIQKSISGSIKYDFTVISSIDTIKIDAQRIEFSSVKINGNEVKFKNTVKELQLFEGFKTGKNILTFNYKATPKQTLYFIGQDENLQIWTQGQGKYTSNWLPSFDDVNEKLIFNLSIDFRNDFEVLSNGKLVNTSTNNKGNIKTWNYSMQKPMSSYLVMLAIGKFEKQVLQSKTRIPLAQYLKLEDKKKFEPTYKYSKEIFDFFETEIGVKYPWQIYKQVPVNDFLYAGMENTSATIFSQDFVVDAIGFNDRNYININAHELAHQWFGNMITAKSGKDHWLQEGFASYYALLAEKKIFGKDYFNYELLKMAKELKKASKTDTIPVLNAKASSLSFYKKGAWALHILREGIGEKNFKKALKNYLNNYKFKNVITDDFLAEIKKISNYDTANFKKNWLEKSGFNTTEAMAIISKNKFIKQYLDLQKSENISFAEKKNQFEAILKSDLFYPIKEEVIYQLAATPFEEKKELIQIAMKTGDVNIRQAIAQTMPKIPLEFKPEYESLLDDKSYATREIALQNLWIQFPENRTILLEKAKIWEGNNDRNLRIIWLTLALATKEYEPTKKTKFYNEIVNYAGTNFDSSIRQNALEVLIKINPSGEIVLQSLANATTHHKWQFVKFAKETIRAMIKKEGFRKLFEELLPKLIDKERLNLEKLLEE
ncbi:M1 family metallopeptidase [Flavobacterium psychrophilum]|uniref:M1 family metallopeptidase n=1 Tax=Flavobacterium psychrophilum TaxID=96345 RepID=UPI000B7C3F78|nr:M1 family metallopeptidase [Flavobacterium psychrophilum]MBF2024319.1 M1 family metallopeptidase [Flavobacterium psychrophilum]MCB5982424.1 M1 family metallopeptidase [Flavobacterium psychrophilum]MCB5995377.1 M1 family metallopeptidase [Flavobacterium psychrophilum]MCB5997393.1 M1 family metallopeptidase [Flavobacterium psychrophilum]MCB6004912.1 M1 family metallopeptidase [Flavobacterium psychrophilum]